MTKIAELVWPITTKQAIDNYQKYLTSFEIDEIASFTELYYINTH